MTQKNLAYKTGSKKRIISKLIIPFFLLFCLQALNSQSLKQVTIQNGTLNYFSKGEGEVIVFIHGAQVDYRVFMPQVDLLSHEYRVVIYSRRYNFPNENKLTGEFNIHTEAADLKKLIEIIGQPVNLVGHSYGGLIALQFSLDHPDMVKSLVVSELALIDWLPILPDCTVSYDFVQRNLIHKTREAFLTGDSTKVMKVLFEFFAGADIQNHVPEEVLRALIANLNEMKALVNSDSAFYAPDPEKIKRINKPMMVLTSEKTMPLLKCTNRKLIDAIPHAIHYHLTDTGHEMWMTSPKKLASIISDFFKD